MAEIKRHRAVYQASETKPIISHGNSDLSLQKLPAYVYGEGPPERWWLVGPCDELMWVMDGEEDELIAMLQLLKKIKAKQP